MYQIVPYGWVYPEGEFNGKTVKRWNRKFDFTVNYKGKKYLEIPCAFDIETTSFMNNDIPVGSMYVWQFAIYDVVYIGRTWGELKKFLKRLVKYTKAKEEKKLVVYVHNLSFEFAFMRKQINFKKVFAISNRRPLYAQTRAIEFRCSYLQSGLSLANLAKEWCGKSNQKLVGDLDYSKMRFCNTPLLYNDICYCVNDVTILTEYIQKQIDKFKGIDKIPYTKTGEVREHCRNACLYTNKRKNKNKQYAALMKELILLPEEYQMLKRAYTGGFTHANFTLANRLLSDVESRDFTSSYPAVMCSEMFPMSRGRLIKRPTKEQVFEHFKKDCCIVNVKFKGLESKFLHENYLSASKCYGKKGVPLYNTKGRILNNGRVISAPYVVTTITEIDFQIISKCYTWESIEFGRLVYYKKGYLPKPIIECVLEFYENKTKLKGLAGWEASYLNNKEKLNSTYGMMVTDIVRDIYSCVNGEWQEPETPDLDTEIKNYNNNKRRFLFYPWGVWIVKYATRNLWSGILNIKEDYVYSDTDSLKVKNIEKHLEYFENYNRNIIIKIDKCLTMYNIDTNKARPKTKEGEEKQLGIWDFDGHYTHFKTLGAKRYFVEYQKDGKLKYQATVAGCPKSAMVDYLIETTDGSTEEIFNAFTANLYIPKGKAGKNILAYVDSPYSALQLDYTGRVCYPSEETCVNVSPNSFDMTMAEDYIRLLKGGYSQL